MSESELFNWEALYESAQRFARACVDNYSVRDAAFFFLHAGASVELAVKAVLCKASPVLLLEGGSRFKDSSLIRLAGLAPAVLPAAGTVAGEQVFTVGFEPAVRRLKLLYGEPVLGVDTAGFAALKAARDVTAHGGQVTASTGESLFRVLLTLATIHNELAPRLGTVPAEFWGPAWPTVENALRERHDEVGRQIAVAYAAARKRFNERIADMDEDSVVRILDQAADRVSPSKSSMPRKCPVCSGKGLSLERPMQRRVHVDGQAPAITHGWLAMNFSCPVCQLTLESEAMVATAPDFDALESADDGLTEAWERDMAEVVARDQDAAEVTGDGAANDWRDPKSGSGPM